MSEEPSNKPGFWTTVRHTKLLIGVFAAFLAAIVAIKSLAGAHHPTTPTIAVTGHVDNSQHTNIDQSQHTNIFSGLTVPPVTDADRAKCNNEHAKCIAVQPRLKAIGLGYNNCSGALADCLEERAKVRARERLVGGPDARATTRAP